MPAVLVEAGVIVNRNEEKRVGELAERRLLAAAIVRGLADCGVTNSSCKQGYSW